MSSAESQPLITVTPKAVATIRQVMSEQKGTGPWYLRVRVVPGGCCGFLHKLDLDPVTTAEDCTFEASGVKIVVFKRQIDMLRGTQVDYGQEGNQQGFKVRNPNFEGEGVKKWLPVLEKEKDVD